MAITDYNKEKSCKVDSINDSGSTISKAQPIICVDGDESTTGFGDIVIDFANISDAQDIACYDQNDSLLDYEIEELDLTNNKAVIWVYNSWTRDDTVQLKVAYGDNSANKKRQTTNVFSNETGIFGAYFFNESSGDLIDHSGNNKDFANTGVTQGVSSSLDGAYSYDGVDDFSSDTDANFTANDLTVIIDSRPGESGTNQVDFANLIWSSNTAGIVIQIDSNGVFDFRVNQNEGASSITPQAGEDYNVAMTYSNDGTGGQGFVNANQEATIADGGPILDQGTLSFGAQDGGGGQQYNGDHTQALIYTQEKPAEFIQAHYDSTSNGGQVFFSQQAAETITVSATVTDSLGFTESTNFTVAFTASDSIGFAENQQGNLIDTLTDSLKFTENTQVALAQTLTDQLDFTETEAFQLVDTLTDSLTFTENTVTQVILTVTASDSLTFGENLDSRLQDTLTDQLDFTETATSTIVQTTADQLGFTEQVQSTVADTLSDQVTFTETILTQSTINFTTSDSLAFTEATQEELQDVLSDNITFAETVTPALAVRETDTLNFSENVASALAQTVSDNLQFQEQVIGSIAKVVTDQLDFTEDIQPQLQDVLTDQLGFTESTASAVAANVSDQLDFTEEFTVLLAETFSDQLTFDEEIIGAFASTVSDTLSFSEQVLFATLLEINAPTKAIINNLNRDALITTKDKFAIMGQHTFKEGDLGDELDATLEDENGAIDLSNADTVDIVMKDRSGTVQLDAEVSIQNASNGKIQYSWSNGDPIDTPGVYRTEFRITDLNGNTETVPNDGYVIIEVEEELG